MKTKTSEFFKKLYIIDINSYAIPDKQMNSFVLCGDNNWDYYFERLLTKYPDEFVSEVENVFLHEFGNEEDLIYFLKNTDREKILDLSTERDFRAVLQLV
jgi:hypothetical protein